MKKNQISESLLLMSLITFSGGLQDAYSYFVRGKVFANAQTGNIILMGANLAKFNIEGIFKYLIPVLLFMIGIFISDQIETKYKHLKKVHWRQIIILIEFILLFISSFIPNNIIANSIISLSCAMQVQSFKKVKGYPFASTMCIGNLSKAVESFSKYITNKQKENLIKSLHYFLIIFIFALGATVGALLSNILGNKLIIISSIILFISFILMFRKHTNNVL